MVELVTLGMSFVGAVCAYMAHNKAHEAKRCAMVAESRAMQARDAAEAAEKHVRCVHVGDIPQMREELRVAVAALPKTRSKRAKTATPAAQ